MEPPEPNKHERTRALIRDLLTKTLANGRTEAEAVKAAAKASELMTQYDLTYEDAHEVREDITARCASNMRGLSVNVWVIMKGPIHGLPCSGDDIGWGLGLLAGLLSVSLRHCWARVNPTADQSSHDCRRRGFSRCAAGGQYRGYFCPPIQELYEKRSLSSLIGLGRSGEIRTPDPLLPK